MLSVGSEDVCSHESVICRAGTESQFLALSPVQRMGTFKTEAAIHGVAQRPALTRVSSLSQVCSCWKMLWRPRRRLGESEGLSGAMSKQ